MSKQVYSVVATECESYLIENIKASFKLDFFETIALTKDKVAFYVSTYLERFNKVHSTYYLDTNYFNVELVVAALYEWHIQEICRVFTAHCIKRDPDETNPT